MPNMKDEKQESEVSAEGKKKLSSEGAGCSSRHVGVLGLYMCLYGIKKIIMSKHE